MALGTVLNKNEKKALLSFIFIYTLSSIILMLIIALLYYTKELDTQKNACKTDLQKSILSVELDLIKAQLNGEKFIYNSKNYPLAIGLYDIKGNTIASSLKYKDINLKEQMCDKAPRVQFVKKLNRSIQGVSFIVAEDSSMSKNIKNLKYLIFLALFFSSIFIAFIGYLLSILLLKPIKEKINQIDHFIKDSAHEINTPVTALLMSVSALKKKGFGEEKLLRHIAISSKQISDIYNTLSHVAFSDIKKQDEIVEFDLKKEILKSIHFYKEIGEAKNVQIIDNLSASYIKMDKLDAQKLINNLLSNAIKFSHNDTSITISLKEDIVVIEDKGIGIKEKNLKEILKRYKRGTEQIGGFGIGLDIVNSICQNYDIKLTIHSKEGEGSTFELDFASVSFK